MFGINVTINRAGCSRVTMLVLMLVGAFCLSSCTRPAGLQTGIWRATLKTQSGPEIPFNFEVKDSAGRKVLFVLNAAERLQVDSIKEGNDSVFIRMPLFDSEIRAAYTSAGLRGKWIKHRSNIDIPMEFSAEHGLAKRFLMAGKPEKGLNLSGRWSASFVSSDGKDTTLAVAEFVQEGARLTGSFLTTTGDFRFLEGMVDGRKLFLSTFDGSHASLFTASVKNNVIADGRFYSGLSAVDNWAAQRDEHAMLPDAYSLTSLKSGENDINFSFPDLEGNPVALTDARFKNKVVVLQFLGSWCPNCMDETAFMAPLYDKYASRGLEVIGLAYERTEDRERSKRSVSELRDRYKIAYPLLLTGYTPKDVLKSMPALANFKAFPTTIIIDKKGEVRKIHTGFSGPGTGKHYLEFVAEFTRSIESLLKER